MESELIKYDAPIPFQRDIKIDGNQAEVHFLILGGRPFLINFEKFCEDTFREELSPLGVDPTMVKWLYTISTFSSIHSGQILLTPIQRNGQIIFTNFKAINVKVKNK